MTTDNFNQMCANCGKGEEESSSLKKCGACMSVKYCSAACQKAHRSQHKKECTLRSAELHEVALFKQPPPLEDCPICFLRMPALRTGNRYQTCCGKRICSGCIHAITMTSGKNMCPFCRAPATTSDEEERERINKRMEVGDTVAIHNLGCHYHFGEKGLRQDRGKAFELWHRAAQLGCTKAYHNIGIAYFYGRGMERNEKKAIHYWELAAMGGDDLARNNLGSLEGRARNYDMALKHFMIAVGGGDNESLKLIKQLFMKGLATRDDYAKALKAYQAYISDIKSNDRDKAAAFSDEYHYY